MFLGSSPFAMVVGREVVGREERSQMTRNPLVELQVFGADVVRSCLPPLTWKVVPSPYEVEADAS